ncbi:hypothetical protein [Corynebacterium sp. HS2168-gen11]|uniref:hypothetical protein n=1 Tax=Corynebacterium sp. HS2168-gen11 TaxID=2974027 RepID=UPI00216B5E4B|nr:hypothetical protein [Corynebacterium sp. HS2168-gen11]MCS4535803.1 hypothetical protein [Corynebacterium sp. HS2168-gen11]
MTVISVRRQSHHQAAKAQGSYSKLRGDTVAVLIHAMVAVVLRMSHGSCSAILQQ